MSGLVGFDNEKYLKEQTDYILDRAGRHKYRLYLECGGKILHDMHAARVLPGYDPDVKMRVFASMTDKIDIIICICAADIVNKKIRADFNRPYDEDVVNMIEDFRKWGIVCDKVVITQYSMQPSADSFKTFLEKKGISVYIHRKIDNYPFDVHRIVSGEGYGSNPYVKTDKPIVIVTAPGPGSGKLATCLSQVYHDCTSGLDSGYAKFETFPIWNLPIDHPVNIAYEAATADLNDVNRVDHFYLEKTGKVSVNYNRDLEAFPVLRSILEKISGGEIEYGSPTEMGVNRCGFSISDDEAVRHAACNEIIRRYLSAKSAYVESKCSAATVDRCFAIMNKARLSVSDRRVVFECENKLKKQIEKKKGKNGITCVGMIELSDGRFVSGTNSFRMHAATAMVFNALKALAGIEDDVDLISKSIIDSVLHMKLDLLHEDGTSLNLDEGLVCLALSAARSKPASAALSHLGDLAGCEAHISHIPSNIDTKTLKKLGINFTNNPVFPGKEYFYI